MLRKWLIIFFFPVLTNADVLHDRLLTAKFFDDVAPYLHQERPLQNAEEFKQAVENLPEHKREALLLFTQKTQDFLPEQGLKAYLYWRYLNPHPEIAQNVLSFLLFYPILALRDYLDHPLSRHRELATQHLKAWTKLETINTSNLFQTLSPILDHQAALLNQMNEASLLAEALKKTEVFAHPFQAEDYSPYVISPLGFLEGQPLSLIPTSERQSVLKELIHQSHEKLTLEASLFYELKELNLLPSLTLATELELLIDDFAPELKKAWENYFQQTPHPSWRFTQIRSGKPSGQLIHLGPPHLHGDGKTPVTPTLYQRKKTLGGFIGTNLHRADGKMTLIHAGISAGGDLPYLFLSHYLPLIDRVQLTLNPKVAPLRGSFRALSSHLPTTRLLIFDMIHHAQSHIYIDAEYFYDPQLVDFLITKKMKNPHLKILLFLSRAESLMMGGFPNTIFLDELTRFGIEIRARKREESFKFISVDSKMAYIGPQDLTPEALNHASPGVQIFDPPEIEALEKKFLKAWRDPELTFIMNSQNYTFRYQDQSADRNQTRLLHALGALWLRTQN